MEPRRLELLNEYRMHRERSNRNRVGEANGRIYIPVPERLSRMGASTTGPAQYADLFEAVMEESPVEVRTGERIVGDYYFLIPGELVELPTRWSTGVQVALPSGHTVGNIERALADGWPGIRSRVEEALEAFAGRGRPTRVEYLLSLLRVLDTVDRRIAAYAGRAKERSISAGRSGDERRAEELAETARTLEALRVRPPAGFREAVQWYWLYVTFERVTSSGMGGIRLDHILRPYYEHDLAAGLIDDDTARDLLVELFLKEGLFYSLGGTDSEGADATCRLSRLALEAYDTIGGPSNLNVRYHASIDRGFLSYAVDVLIRHRSGVPNIVNDEAVVTQLSHYGCSIEEARGYAFGGCFWYVLPGKEYPYHDMEAVSAVEILADTVEESRTDPPPTFEAFFDRFLDRQHRAVDRLERDLAQLEEEHRPGLPEPVLTLVMDGTVERGVDVTEWAEHSMTTVLYVGLATVTDSLYAIQSLVYERSQLSWGELFNALDGNFSGRAGEALRHRLLSAPKFGTDEEVVDELAATLAASFCDELSGRRNRKGFGYRPAFYSWNRHVFDGSRLGATPDGRSAGMPVSQGVNPAQGRATEGITAALGSVGKIDLSETAGAPVHLHLNGVTASREGGKLEALITSAFELGIPQVILNVTDARTLEDAVEHPERYWDLVVRVTGYSARFVQCSPEIQRDIIARTEHAVS